MILLLLILIACTIVLGFIYKFYKDKAAIVENESTALHNSQIELTNTKVATLTNEVNKTKALFIENEEKINALKVENENQLLGQNIPIIEITAIDIADDDNEKQMDANKRLIYNHQLKFSLVNIGNYSLKEVIFSIKDIYNDANDSKSKKKLSEVNYMGKKVESDVGSYNNIELNTLNLKSKKQVYVCNLPVSYGVADYYFDIVVEWNTGFYHSHIDVEEVNGKLKYHYNFFDSTGKEFELKV
jgi:hypothetical protein